MLNLHQVGGAYVHVALGLSGLELGDIMWKSHCYRQLKGRPGLVRTRCTEKEHTGTRGHPGGRGLCKLKHHCSQRDSMGSWVKCLSLKAELTGR